MRWLILYIRMVSFHYRKLTIYLTKKQKNFFLIMWICLQTKYIDEMNKNGKKNGSYFKGSFLGEDLFFCHEVTKSLQLIILESLGE